MKIVNVNKFYYLRGGAERYFFSLTDLLASHGHEVIPFAMQHPQNLTTPYAKYFPSYVEFGTSSRRGDAKRGTLIEPQQPKAMRSDGGGERQDPELWLSNILRVIGRMFWSFESAKKFDQLLTATKPDLIHLHNIYHQLSPSILPVAKRHDIPVVMTVHDYNLMWPDYLLCGYAPGASYWNVIRNRCTQGSYMKSIVSVLEKKFHDWLRVYQKHIDLFLSPSEFVKEKLIAGGYDAKKIRVLPHFVTVEKFKVSDASRSRIILYFGRLSKEKGVDILLQMMHSMESDTRPVRGRPAEGTATTASGRSASNGVELRIAGEGPELQRLKLKVKSKKLPVTFLGRLDTKALQKEIDRAAIVVIPSIVPETFGYTILESFARGKPVVASRIGAFPELVEEGKTGFLVRPGDIGELQEKVNFLLTNAKECIAMGNRARLVAEKYNASAHYVALQEYYEHVQ